MPLGGIKDEHFSWYNTSCQLGLRSQIKMMDKFSCTYKSNSEEMENNEDEKEILTKIDELQGKLQKLQDDIENYLNHESEEDNDSMI